MLYFVVRIAVYMLALYLTFFLLPGLHMDLAHIVPAAELAKASPADLAAYHSLLSWLSFFQYFALAAGFWFWNWLLWPVILFFTGRIVLWSLGLLLIIVNALVFYLVTINGQSPGIWADSPVVVWCILGGLSMAFWSVLLEGVTGLDSPLQTHTQSRRRYWRFLRWLSLGGRNYFTENLRIAQSLDIVTMYLKDIAFDNSPLGPIRRVSQHMIYWFKKPLIDESTPETVRYMLQELGPIYVELGQAVAGRAERLPLEWREQMALLQSTVTPLPAATAVTLVQGELGASIDQLYAAFDDRPLAVDSTSEVHLATLLGGREVAVKVQRPDIDVTVSADLNVVRDLVRHLEKRFQWARASNLGAITNECAENVLRDLDYANAAFNGRMLAKNMELFPQVHVPAVYTELSARRVLTQEFVRGASLADPAALDAAGVDRTQLAAVFTRAIAKQVLQDGFFHGELRPDKVLVNTKTAQIVFPDVGKVGTLTSAQRTNLVNLLRALAQDDRDELAKTVLNATGGSGAADERAFAADMDRRLTRHTALEDTSTFLAGAVKAILGAVQNAELQLEPELLFALKALIQAEETVRALDPSLALAGVAFAAAKEPPVEKLRLNGKLPTNGAHAAGDLVLVPAEIRQFKDALHGAFERPGLEQVVFFGLEVRMEDVVVQSTYDKEVTDLVIWANENNKAATLLEAARKENPGNVDLREFADRIKTRQL